MVGDGHVSEVEINCPFCGKAKINIIRKESMNQPKVSRISSGKSSTTYRRTGVMCIVATDCPICGRKKNDIRRALDGEIGTKTHEERLKRLQASGLPTKIVNKRG